MSRAALSQSARAAAGAPLDERTKSILGRVHSMWMRTEVDGGLSEVEEGLPVRLG